MASTAEVTARFAGAGCGQRRKRRQDREVEERMSKKAKTGDDNQATTTPSAGAPLFASKRTPRNIITGVLPQKRHFGFQSHRVELRELEHQGENESDDENVNITNVTGNPCQGDMKWTINNVSDFRVAEDPLIKIAMDDMAHNDENTWRGLISIWSSGEKKVDIARLEKMGVCSHVRWSAVVKEPDGKFVKVKQVWTNEGTLVQPNVRCRLVAQELGVRADEFWSGTPSLMTLKMVSISCFLTGREECFLR